MPAITLSDIRTALAAMYGDASAPNDSLRDTYINLSIENIYGMELWGFRRKTMNVTFDSSGVSTTTLTGFVSDSFPTFTPGTTLKDPKKKGEARLVVSGGQDIVYTGIPSEYRDSYGTSDYVTWVTGNEVDGYRLNIPQTDSRTLSVTFFKGKDTLSLDDDTTYIPYKNVIAAGAYMMLVKNDDISRNNRLEQLEFERHLGILRAMQGSSVAKTYAPLSFYSGNYLGRT